MQYHNSTKTNRNTNGISELESLRAENEQLRRELEEAESREDTLFKALICCVVPWWKAKRIIGDSPWEGRE